MKKKLLTMLAALFLTFGVAGTSTAQAGMLYTSCGQTIVYSGGRFGVRAHCSQNGGTVIAVRALARCNSGAWISASQWAYNTDAYSYVYCPAGYSVTSTGHETYG